jgi:hypothetical protein
VVREEHTSGLPLIDRVLNSSAITHSIFDRYFDRAFRTIPSAAQDLILHILKKELPQRQQLLDVFLDLGGRLGMEIPEKCKVYTTAVDPEQEFPDRGPLELL